jgi:cellulose synthase/poly-beta-1,6-N-acetylglucosamine synthase-like glycosyltransferase
MSASSSVCSFLTSSSLVLHHFVKKPQLTLEVRAKQSLGKSASWVSDQISGKQEEWQWPLQSTTKETIPRICLPDLKTSVIGVFVIIMTSCHLCLQLSLLGFAALAYHFMFLLLPHTNKHTKLINYYTSLCCSFKMTVSYKHWISVPHNCNLQILAQWVETCHLEVRDSMCQECFISFKRGKQMHHSLHCEQTFIVNFKLSNYPKKLLKP